jgi:hypothetical protein
MAEKLKFTNPEEFAEIRLERGDQVEFMSRFNMDLELTRNQDLEYHIAFVREAYEIIHTKHLEIAAGVKALAAERGIPYETIPHYGQNTPRASLWERIKNVF